LPNLPNQSHKQLLKFAFAFAALLILANCTKPQFVPGNGTLLRIKMTEWESGSTGAVSFSRTEVPIKSPNCEMECDFSDGTTLRGPCYESGAIVDDFGYLAPASIDSQIVTTRSLSQADLDCLPGGAKPPKKPVSGWYQMPKPHPALTVSYDATIQTNRLPTRFRIFHGKVKTFESTITLVYR